MNHVFVVVATRESEVEVCETFSGLASLGRAFQLASDKSGRGRIDLFNASPAEETLADGSKRWVFMDTNKQSVVVFYREVVDTLMDSRDPNNLAVGLSTTKDVPKDVVPTGYGDTHLLKKSLPPRGTLSHINDGLQKALDNAIRASLYITDGLPYGAGGNLAKAILDKGLAREEWDNLVIDIQGIPSGMLISAFFNSFLQMIADHDQGYLESVKGALWLTDFAFQSENIERWMEDFEPLPPPFDFMDRTLPAGWNLDDKAILLGQFLDDPDNVKDPLFELSEDQKWALVTARIRKSPNFAMIPEGLSGYIPSRIDSLKAVEDRTDLGMKIRNADIKKLHTLLSELLDTHYNLNP